MIYEIGKQNGTLDNSIGGHPHLNHDRFPMDGALVGVW